MIAKEVAMPKGGGSFRGLMTYLTSARGKTERLGRVRLEASVEGGIAVDVGAEREVDGEGDVSRRVGRRSEDEAIDVRAVARLGDGAVDYL